MIAGNGEKIYRNAKWHAFPQKLDVYVYQVLFREITNMEKVRRTIKCRKKNSKEFLLCQSSFVVLCKTEKWSKNQSQHQILQRLWYFSIILVSPWAYDICQIYSNLWGILIFCKHHRHDDVKDNIFHWWACGTVNIANTCTLFVLPTYYHCEKTVVGNMN